MNWNDLQIILAICRSGSLSAAAKSLGVNKSTVSRQINTIEKNMGVRFFDRLPQGYLMTDAGEMVMRLASRMEQDAAMIERELLGKDFRLHGNIRLTAPEGIASILLPPLLAEFCQQHPGIDINLEVTSEALELSRREADLAVRVTRKPPDTSLGRCVGVFNFCLYASASYMETHQNIALDEHKWICIKNEIDWLIPLIWKKQEVANQYIVFKSNSTTVAMNTAKQGMGVILLPCFLGDYEQKLERVRAPFDELALEMWLLTHPDLRNTARVRTLMQYLYDALSTKGDALAGRI